jgi:hypothetical protein
MYFFFQSWHKPKNSVAIEIKLPYSQPFMDSHFCCVIVEESATSQVFIQRPSSNSRTPSAILQQDNATTHSKRGTKLLLQSFQCELLDQPFYCLDKHFSVL